REEMKKEAFVTARYRIFLFHIPLGKSEVGPELERIWGPVMNEAKIDLVICGHTHTYKRMAPIAGQFNFHTLIGGGPNKGASDMETAIQVQVKETELSVVVTRADQTVVDEFTIAAG
ncbi:metallophosphoesterase, partial [candidate division KSB1 bacterium]|nr:metallophosphoesterase [candidate division KSB1 bacterium]